MASSDDLLQRLTSDHIASRIWARDLGVFGGANAPPATRESVRTRLGWLDVPTGMAPHVPELETFAAEARQDGLTDVYLLGMGGSSLCAEVLRDIPLAHHAGARLTILDTTDERTIRGVTEALDPARALFLVASKSGSTIEVTSLEHHFWGVMTAAGRTDVARHFVAITDPDTSLVTHASEARYRRTFLNPPDIGGRYSALSLFGLVPASLLGLDLRDLLTRAQEMADRCRADDAGNPGLALGAFLGAQARAGRDKLTLLVPDELAPLGVWIEQLIAESTGKQGTGILPIVGEPAGTPDSYGPDRQFVALLTSNSSSVRDLAMRLEQAGSPVLRIETAPANLGAEFFRWEFATAVAGHALGINPFDEPNVKDAKQRTQQQLDARRATGSFRIEPPLVSEGGVARRAQQPTAAAPASGRYIAILDYMPPQSGRTAVVERLRAAILKRLKVATTYGVGPRYLHSTGQYHKGGPNTGLFLLMTAADATATPVPGADYTFSTLKYAQALGDFEALAAAGRQVIQCHVENANADFGAALARAVERLP